MMSQCFIVNPAITESGTIIFGRNSLKNEDCSELVHFEKSDNSEKFGGPVNYSIILCRAICEGSDKEFGGDYGSNSENLCISLILAEKNEDDGLLATDIVRIVLERSSNCEEAINVIKELVTNHGSDTSKYCFLVCDKSEAFYVNIATKEVSSEKITDNYRSLTADVWPSDTPSEGFNVTNMFEVLRKAANNDTKSSFVAVLNSSGLSYYWFTATPNPNESVFKPYVFTPSAKISPLTKIPDNDSVTLLHKLHSNRKWDQVGELLKSLEKTCVEEVNNFIGDMEELDELLKDCTEAEVKFYR